MATGKKRWNKLTDEQKKNTYSSYTGVAPEHVDLTGMDYNDLPKDVKKGVKQSQLKAKLLKIKLAEQKKWSATGLSPEEVQKVRADHEKRRKYMKLDPTKNKNKVTESDFQSGNFEIKDAKSKVNKLKKKYVDPNPQAETPEEIMQSAESAGREPSYIAQEHGHRISFRAHSAGNYKTASLNEQSGKYAKYWLLNAKDTNGNGWGIAAHTAKDNMKKFIGRPLVVTASSWHGASEYGDQYEHPYLPTNDITAILDHQEKFRVGSIVDVVEDSHGDWYANVEMLPKFANSRLPPFCSPAIYQLDASEAEGQISKWEALHLAALTENPAYGARIALLKGTCVGTGSECKVQFKVAKQKTAEINLDKHTKRMREIINDPYSATEVEDNKDLEYPVTKWDGGEEYAVFSNKSGKPLLDNKFDSKYPPKNIEFLKQFDNPEDALDYSEYRHSDEYGGSIFSNDKHYIGLEKKFKENRYTTKPGESKRDIHELDNPNKYASIECPKKKQKISRLKSKLAVGYMGERPDERNREYRKKEEAALKVRGKKRIPPSRVSLKTVKGGIFSQRSPKEKSAFHKRMLRLNKDRGNIQSDQKILNVKREMFPEHSSLTPHFQKKHEVGSNELGFTNKEAEHLGKQDPTEKVIREVKDPEKKKDLLNRLDENPNEYGPKNYGATKPKNFGKKIGKLKSRIAAVGLKNVDENPLGRRQKTVGTPAEVRQAFVEGRSLRSGNRMEDGVRTADAHQTDGENLFLFGNKILTKDGKGGYITNAKEWMGKGYKNATLKEYRALGIPVDTKGIIDPSRKYYSPDGKLLKTKGLEGNLNKEDITISKEQLFEGEVRLGDSTKAKPKVVDPNARRPLDNRHNLREFASSSRKRLTGDASATRTPPYSETATQPEDAMLSNELLGFSKEHGLEKTFGKKTKTDSVFNLGIKGEYSKVPGPDTHHIGYKKLFRRPTGINPTSDLKHYRNTKTSPPGNKHQPFFNRGNNAIQLNTDEHTGGEQYAPQGLPSTRGTGRHSVHSLNPHENFKSILHSKLKARLANLGEQNMTYQDSKKVKIHKKKNMEKHDKS